LIGFEGAPGHQAGTKLGSYEGGLRLKGRWDPLVAIVGGVWDQLLAEQIDVWAALATSDFHGEQEYAGAADYPPGRFSETWLLAPDRTARGALQALRAGTFFSAHGHIVRGVDLALVTEDLPRPAHAGETVALKTPATCQVRFTFETPPTDWRQQPNRIESVELIGVTAETTAVLGASQKLANGEPVIFSVEVPAGGMVIRARGRRSAADGPDLEFYTNPIRVQPL
jgi:hypothetical protein